LVCALKVRRAIEITETIPAERPFETGEKYTILGKMVISNAAISTRKESIEQFFSPLKKDTKNIEQIKLIVPTMTTTAKKAIKNMFQSLQSHFMDNSFEDVSGTGKFSGTLAMTSGSKILTLVEVKNYKGAVPMLEVEEFLRDKERSGRLYGVFVSMGVIDARRREIN